MTAVPNLLDRLTAAGGRDADTLFELFLDWVADLELTLYPAQEDAILEILSDSHVILKTPTGSGKSLVAQAQHYQAFANGKRSFYTSPIKALVSEKFFDLCDVFGAESVGMMTGDATINRDAPIICCTAEILSNMALREGSAADVDYVCMDEFHYYSDRDRGIAWQVPLLILSRATFLLMSATLGDTEAIEEGIARLTGRPVAVVASDDRPVPLAFSYSMDPIHEAIEKLVSGNRAPIYLVNFTQRECAEQAQNLMSTNFSSREEKQALLAAIRTVEFDTPYGKEMQRYIKHGLGLHHGGLLPKYRLLVERLARKGMLKVICGTDTLGVGVNVPIRTVLFTKLCKFDGEKVGLLSVRDFKQIAGRAGRKGFDDNGYVVAQAPEHVVENKRLELKAAAGTGKKKKVVRRQPPTKGFVPWSETTFKGLVERAPEPLTSSFDIDHGLLLNLMQRPDANESRGGGYRVLMSLIDKSHTSAAVARRLRRKARQLFKALVVAGLLEVVDRVGEPGREVVVSDTLQDDFTLLHSLSLFLVEALAVLSPTDPNYALDLVSFVEAVMEHPRMVLYAQENKIKGVLVAQMKADGLDYEQRMERLEKVSWPKPKAELLYTLFDSFAQSHPWVKADNIRPKSILRDMYEQYVTFNDYVRHLGLERAEGVLLRYLSTGYKTLVQSVPEPMKTEEVHDIIAFFRTLLARVDASLVREWERLLYGGGEANEANDAPLDITRDKRAFFARIRAELHALVKALSNSDFDEAAKLVRQDAADPWPASHFEAALSPFIEAHGGVTFDHSARLADKTRIAEDGPHRWTVSQVLVDPEGDNLWAIEGLVDLSDDLAPTGSLVEVRHIGD